MSGSDDDDDDDGGDASVLGGVRRRASSAREWLLLDGSRLRISGGIAVLLAVFFGAAMVAGYVPLEQHQAVLYLFSSLLGGNFTLITVVVSINQLLLSQELSSPGQLEDQINNVIDYREGVEDTAGRLAPVDPMGFFRLLFENTRQEAQQLGGLAAGSAPEEAYDEIDEFVGSLTRHVDRIDDMLADSETDIFSVLSVTLTTNYARHIHQIRKIREEYEGDLTEPIRDGTDTLIDSLQKIDIARQYFKGVYLQDELARLSRFLFYAGFPAEAITALGLLALTGSTVTSIPDPFLHEFIFVVLIAGFTPLALLCAYILRIATVTQRTAATLPFTTPQQEQ